MKIKVLHYSAVVWSFFVLFLPAEIAFAGKADKCHVIGDTSDSDPSKSLGSKQNPYESLADVEADADCESIIVLYSSVVLDGGITLMDGQKLEGRKGPGKALPIISNTTAAANNGHGVQLAANNTIANLHIRETHNSGVVGGNVGDLSIKDSLITGFGQSEALDPGPLGILTSPPGISLVPTDDVTISMTKTELGESNSTSVSIISLAGHADITIDRLTVRDQGHVDGADISPGITVVSVGVSSVDVDMRKPSVSNIGSGLSNSDGMLILAIGSSALTIVIDGYSYLNPDGDGGGSATGLEIGNFLGVGASFEATVKNSTFQGGTSVAIQIIDQDVGNSNFLTAHIHDNEIYDAAFTAIELDIGFGASYGTDIVTIEDNLIVNAGGSGIEVFSVFEPQTVLNVLVQRNTIINSGIAGLAFSQNVGASAATLNLDAGLGGLGSEGKNKIIDSQFADIYVETFNCCEFPISPPFAVDAANNWWGNAAGPATVIELGGASVDYTPFLTKEPKDK